MTHRSAKWKKGEMFLSLCQLQISHCEPGALIGECALWLTICLYHGLPASPSRLVNARSAIINRSLISLTFSGFCLVFRLQFSACSSYIQRDEVF
jgi:hypothetical protein